jgi:predicted transcriptional regulator
MDLMYENGIGRLAVVEKGSPHRLMGIVTRSDVIQAYERWTKRKEDDATALRKK